VTITELKKPWEETWTYEIESEGDFGCLVMPRDDALFTSIARAQLAAQAPAMARLLLKAVHKQPTGQEWGCLGCGAWEEGDHEPECELTKVLRDAGVTP
jgi:hypothetical protein